MNRDDKTAAIAELREMLQNAPFFYLADSSSLPVEKVNLLRRQCFEKGITMKVAKNKLIQKALEGAASEKGYEQLFAALEGPTTLLISENPKAPAKLISEFRKTSERPLLKAAYIDSSVYLGDDMLESLTKIRSKEEVLGEIITILQSPIKNVVGAITSSGSKIAGIVKALEERNA